MHLCMSRITTIALQFLHLDNMSKRFLNTNSALQRNKVGFESHATKAAAADNQRRQLINSSDPSYEVEFPALASIVSSSVPRKGKRRTKNDLDVNLEQGQDDQLGRDRLPKAEAISDLDSVSHVSHKDGSSKHRDGKLLLDNVNAGRHRKSRPKTETETDLGTQFEQRSNGQSGLDGMQEVKLDQGKDEQLGRDSLPEAEATISELDSASQKDWSTPTMRPGLCSASQPFRFGTVDYPRATDHLSAGCYGKSKQKTRIDWESQIENSLNERSGLDGLQEDEARFRVKSARQGNNTYPPNRGGKRSSCWRQQPCETSPEQRMGARSFDNIPFDICINEGRNWPPMNSILPCDNISKCIEFDPSLEGNGKILGPGMVLLKRYIPLSIQVDIALRCRDLGIGEGGFYRPGFQDGAKLSLHMMCFGLDWDAQTKKYGKRRNHDDAIPPDIPPDFNTLVGQALHDSQEVIKQQLSRSDVDEILPIMKPDICIVNFYTTNGRLGLHQDRDESRRSISRGLPVVSFSIGDSAEFLYGVKRDVEKAERVLLESGDVLIFGGDSRQIFHGVASVVSKTAPKALVEQAKLRPGRLNLTLRKY